MKISLKKPDFQFDAIFKQEIDESDRAEVPGIKVTWPELNPIKLSILEKHLIRKNRMVKIYSYRYPAINKDKPIGIIYLIHGYTDHLGNKAHIARKFAEAGYDVVGLDMKGFGRSEGDRCYIKYMTDLLDQHLEFQEVTCKYYKE